VRPAAVGVLGMGGVALGMAGWWSRNCSELWECSGRWYPQKEGWPWEWLSDVKKSDLRKCLVICLGFSRWGGTCIVILVQIKIWPIQLPPPPSPSSNPRKRRRGADWCLLWFEK